MPTEQTANVIEEDAPQAVAETADGSLATADEVPQHASEDQAGADDQQSTATETGAGETDGQQSEQTGEATAAEDEQVTQEARNEPKKRTAKRIEKLLTEKRLTEQENEALKAQLRAQLLNQGTAQAQPEPAARSQQSVPSPTVQSQDSSEAIAQRYHAEQDPVVKQQLAVRYKEAERRETIEAAKREIREESRREAEASRMSQELAELNEIAPIFRAGSAELDKESPLVKAALAEATRLGQPIQNWQQFLYFGHKAAAKLAMQGGLQARVRANAAETKLKTTLTKTGLETGNRGAVAASAGNQTREAKFKQLAARAEKGDVQAQREITRMQLAGVFQS